MKLSFKQKFNTRQEISVLLGGDTQKGIAVSAQTDTILLFMNDGEIYTDYFLSHRFLFPLYVHRDRSERTSG